MKKIPFPADHDPHAPSAQYLEDLATGYWYSEALFAAVEMDIFSLLDQDGATAGELSRMLSADAAGLDRFLNTLVQTGLLAVHKKRYFNTVISSEHLVSGKDGYMGGSILWRRELQPYWKGLAECVKAGGRTDYPGKDDADERAGRIRKYISAMDAVARTKTDEILGFFGKGRVRGRLLDVGAGSGAVTTAFLKQHPDISATLMDLPQVLDQTKVFMKGRGLGRRISYLAANILEQWPVRRAWFDIVVLSNIIHAYSEKELPHILGMAAASLKKNGIMLIHDFFSEHHAEKAALSDLNMFINTYNGRVFSSRHVLSQLEKTGLASTGLLPLGSDTAVIMASKSVKALEGLCIDPLGRLLQRMKETGFRKAVLLNREDILISDWPGIKCRFGCSRYGSGHCPPNSLHPEETKAVMESYRHAVLLEGEPPTREFQLKVLKAEKEAFLGGFHKAFSFWAGPCSICDRCTADSRCRNTQNARPSMEGSGIDVFNTARKAGIKLRTLKSRTDAVKYFGLVLLD